ncbi:MAG TPA: penicillin-binding transpeptidase domain-containing protein, partial [Tissierellaceae bacterium]|nr:penicillin-binding transpeptidase domain-containing protein [Tissierellaceae bacterium]
AMITSAIANNGQMVRPILVKEVINRNDKVIEKFETEIITQSISSSTANQVKEMMLEAVETGTGTNAKSKEFKIAGKTGTAENPSGKSHSWFTGFAPYEDPQFVVTVLIEEAGATGGQVAAPIAREILTYAYKNLDI